MNHIGKDELHLWDDEEGFFYDVLYYPDGSRQHLKVRSMVGLILLFAVTTLEPELLDSLPGFATRLKWLIDPVSPMGPQNQPVLCLAVTPTGTAPSGSRSTICPLNRCKSITTTSETSSKCNAPPGLATG